MLPPCAGWAKLYQSPETSLWLDLYIQQIRVAHEVAGADVDQVNPFEADVDQVNLHEAAPISPDHRFVQLRFVQDPFAPFEDDDMYSCCPVLLDAPRNFVDLRN